MNSFDLGPFIITRRFPSRFTLTDKETGVTRKVPKRIWFKYLELLAMLSEKQLDQVHKNDIATVLTLRFMGSIEAPDSMAAQMFVSRPSESLIAAAMIATRSD